MYLLTCNHVITMLNWNNPIALRSHIKRHRVEKTNASSRADPLKNVQKVKTNSAVIICLIMHVYSIYQISISALYVFLNPSDHDVKKGMDGWGQLAATDSAGWDGFEELKKWKDEVFMGRPTSSHWLWLSSPRQEAAASSYYLDSTPLTRIFWVGQIF